MYYSCGFVMAAVAEPAALAAAAERGSTLYSAAYAVFGTLGSASQSRERAANSSEHSMTVHKY